MAIAVSMATIVLATAGRSWTWTGFQGEVSLWEWLQLLGRPLAFIALLVWLVDPPNPRRWMLAFGACVLALVVLMIGGYALHWEWTGFGEYRLWDWMELLILPVMLVVLPMWLRVGTLVSRRILMALGIAAIMFGLVVIAGYVFDWGWTGFEGHTFRDWLYLLIEPFLLPIVCRWSLESQGQLPDRRDRIM